MTRTEYVELDLGEVVLVLYGNVLEVFVQKASSRRWHLTHVAVDLRPERRSDTVTYVVGSRIGDLMVNSVPVSVELADQPRAAAFFDEARRRRAAVTPTTS